MKLRLLLSAIHFLSLLSCSLSCSFSDGSDVSERTEFWQDVVDRVNSSTVFVAQLQQEYAKYSITNPDKNGYLRIIEHRVKDVGAPCNHWDIGLKAELNENGVVSNAELKMYCTSVEDF